MGARVSVLGIGTLDELARRESAAARLDPRTKVVLTLAFVAVVASFGRLELARLAPLTLYPLGLALLGDVPARPLLVRLALASPFALGVAAFEPFLDRSPALSIGGVTVSAGTLALATIVAKFLLSLSAALLLIATTRFEEVCHALGRLGMPRALVSQLLLTFRYLFVLGDEAGRLLRAHALRAPEKPRPGLATVGPMLGQLLLRALGRADRIHVAMRCRGFAGALPLRRAWALGRGDALFAAATVALLFVSRAVDLPGWLGTVMMGGAR